MKKTLPKSAKEKLKLIKKALRHGVSVSKACRRVEISRMTYYRWSASSHPRKLKSTRRKEQVLLKRKLLRLVVAHPHLSCAQLAEKLGQNESFTWQILNQDNLGTRKLRKRWAQKIGSYPPKKEKYEREFGKRVILLERAQKVGVSRACREFGVSRMLFYKWKRRQLVGEPLVDREWKVLRWGRQTPEGYERLVLKLVARHPELSVHRLFQSLPRVAGIPVVGHHGVQNILRRNNLNLYERRLAYAQAQAPVSLIQPVTSWLGRLKSVWETFVPQVAPAPPPAFKERFLSFLRLFTLSLFSTTIFSTLFVFWISMLASHPGGLRIGLFFASISLLVGTFFFIYSMKYYFTLALVLSFSSQTGPFDSAQGKEGSSSARQGWLARIFGLNGSFGGPTSLKSSTEVGPHGVPAGGLQPNLDHIKLSRYPFISVHLPFYNEKNVVNRILAACTSFDYPASPQGGENYEVIVCDDSTDETVQILKDWEKHPKVKILHRPNREGFKGGALKYALKAMDPRTEFVLVFDADFVPYPDTLEQFMKYFKATGGWSEEKNYQGGKIQTMPYETFKKVDISTSTSSVLEEQLQQMKEKSQTAVVAGYQWHVLNKSENWITRGVRTEYAGSYVIERPGQEILSALKIIHGSVYCIRADVLKHFGWGTSITEDFELTLRIYEKGFKVVYTPYIQAPSECVSTIKRLIRQRMRWAEGHSFNVRKMFTKLMFGTRIQANEKARMNANERIWQPSPLTFTEKLEFLYISPYYLQAFFFLVGTLSWLISETVFAARLPFWTSLWGWSLVLTNFFSLPLMNAVGLFLEESEEKDYLGLLSFVALSYLLVPFQAYAAVKGFLEKQEGPWFRTPKTGLITDIFTRGRFYRWLTGILPGRAQPAAAQFLISNYSNQISRLRQGFGGQANPNDQPASPPGGLGQLGIRSIRSISNPYLALATANNRFDNFRVRPKRLRWIGRTVIAVVLVFAILLNIFSFTQNSSTLPALDSSKLTLDGKKEFPIEGRDTFTRTETPQFHLKIPSNQPRKTSFLKKFFNNEAQAAEPEIKTSLFDSSGVLVEGVNTRVSKDESGYQLSLVDNTGLKPGKYTLKAQWDSEDGKSYESSQDFRWGVLAINTNKSMYTSGEDIKFSFGVLDDRGATICDARLVLDITAPSGEKITLSSQNGLIKQNEGCTPKGATKGPDYLGQLPVNKLGSYRLHLVADTQNGQRSIDETIEVKDIKDIPFDIERTDFPTRIYPPTPYSVLLTIKANQDFTGTISDQVPASFEISKSANSQILQMTDTTTQGIREFINWNVSLKKGEIYQLGYTIKFPRVSPEFYLIGPVRFAPFAPFDRAQGKPIFEEARRWQIAGDVVTTIFMETPDATNYTTGDMGTQFWTSVSGSVTYDTTQKKSGRGSWKADSGAGNAPAYFQTPNILADAGRRITFYIYLPDLPTADITLYVLLTSGSFGVAKIKLTSAGVLKLFDGDDFQIGSNGSTLSTGIWYRLSLSYVITSTTVNEFRLFLDGSLDISVTNTVLPNVGSNYARLGWVGNPGANKVLNLHHVYMDDSTVLTDPGDIRITAKLPNANSTNTFDTAIGANPANRWTNVNERPISETNGWRQAATADNTENYGLESASQGDVDISGNTLVARTVWVWAKRAGGSGACGSTADMWDNNSASAITLTTAGALYTKITDSTTYPSNPAAGMNSCTAAQDTFFYETGVLVASLGDPIPEFALALAPLAAFLPKIIKSIQQGTLAEDMRGLVKRIFGAFNKLLHGYIARLLDCYIVRLLRRKREKEKWKHEENL